MITPMAAPKKPGFGLRFLMGLVLIPLGLMLRVLSQIYLEITSEAVLYWQLMGIVTVGHMLLFCVSALALLRFRRSPLAVAAAFRLWIGYGIGAALLVIKDLG
jgi:hypothetical protein